MGLKATKAVRQVQTKVFVDDLRDCPVDGSAIARRRIRRFQSKLISRSADDIRIVQFHGRLKFWYRSRFMLLVAIHRNDPVIFSAGCEAESINKAPSITDVSTMSDDVDI